MFSNAECFAVKGEGAASPGGVRGGFGIGEERVKGPTIESGRVVKFALMPDRENANSILRGKEAVEGDVAGLAVGNHQLAQLSNDSAADQRMVCECVDGFADNDGGGCGGSRVVLGEKGERPLEVGERVFRIDDYYLRHGFGRVAFPFLASRSNQSCTSPAR